MQSDISWCHWHHLTLDVYFNDKKLILERPFQKTCRRAIFNQFQPETKPCAKNLPGTHDDKLNRGIWPWHTRPSYCQIDIISRQYRFTSIVERLISIKHIKNRATRQVIPNLVPILSQYSMYTITKSENKRNTGPCHPQEYNILFCQLP